MVSQVTVLVTSAGSAPAVAVITALRDQQEILVRVAAADMDPLSVGFHLSDASVIVPAASNPGFEEALLRPLKMLPGEAILPRLGEFRADLMMQRHWTEVFVEEASSVAICSLRTAANDPVPVAELSGARE